VKGGRQGIRECKFTDMKRMRTVRSSYAGLPGGAPVRGIHGVLRAGYSRGPRAGLRRVRMMLVQLTQPLSYRPPQHYLN
jgi:hypothetical protein